MNTVDESRLAVSNALQCGSDAVVISFSQYDCSNASSFASTIKQVFLGIDLQFNFNHLRIKVRRPDQVPKAI